MWGRGLISIRNGLVVSRCRMSAVAGSSAEIDDFLHTISSATTHSSVKKVAVLETAPEFFKWLEQNPVKSVENFINAARLSINVKSEDQGKVFSRINKIATSVLPSFYGNLGPTEIVEMLRFALQINTKSQISSDIQKLFLEKNFKAVDLRDVPFPTLVMLIRYSDSSVDQKVLDTIADSLLSRIEKELGNAADLLTILAGEGVQRSKWFYNEAFIKAAEKLVPVMGLPEKCALLKHMSIHRQRNRQLLGAIVHSISTSNQCLSIPQIVSVVSACASLTYYPPKIAKKISDDLIKNSNVLDNWNDIIVITDSFVRMRMGDQNSWKLLVRWATENVKQANVVQLSRFVSGLARVGEPSGKPLAKVLRPLLAKERALKQTAWLNTVYSLAYFQELDESLADSVLNKSFVDQVMSSTMEVHDRLRKAMTLMLISSAARVDMQGKYHGPTVNKETFASYGITFDAKTIRNARQLKYSSNPVECDGIFLKSLFKIAPQDTHCGLPNVEECGAFVDAYVMPDEKSELLVNTSQWGTNKPRPLFFYGWMQTKQNVSNMTSEDNILGQEQLGLRLIRAQGYNPVVVYKSEFDYCSSDIEKIFICSVIILVNKKPSYVMLVFL
ncbi:hypothetical protein B9Z55_014482 [Caenorhabditis nigoni]|uniref:RAP domain-containing protein n=1 Tax=Caenorhabditis nigoni TaxID=1611254 RepID=A0A2G5U622_9PELO|nr:hypothetical protein B9Z55_014482 [Caenorhabditis nigoni]